MLKQNLVRGYNEHSATHNYIFTITVDGEKVACFVRDLRQLDSLSYLDNARKALRFRPNKAQRQLILSLSEKIVPLCTAESFKAMAKKPMANKNGKLVHYNNGEHAERLVTEKLGQVWEKDNLPWWNGGDVVDSEGVAWQVKDESNATYCHLEQFEKNGWVL